MFSGFTPIPGRYYKGRQIPTSPNPRRLIVCCDGTWQSSATDHDNVPSNITRLARIFEPHAYDEGTGTWWQQIVYYDAGVGTGDAGGLGKIEFIRKGGTGDGLNENVIEAYNFLVNNYEYGDEIFCFGFSRGAYTARAVAGLVTEIGVLMKRNMVFFPEIYRQYKSNLDGKSFRTTDAFKNLAERFGLDYEGVSWATPTVKVVGTFDTVGALGVPDILGIDMASWRREHGFHNTALSPVIHNAFQALALDDHREPFGPTLWHLPPPPPSSPGKPPVRITNLEQCWFPGMHINVGGGSDDQIKGGRSDREQIATLTLAWMIDRCRPFLAFDDDALFRIYVEHAILTGDPSYSGDWEPSVPAYVTHKPAPTKIQNMKNYFASLAGYVTPSEDKHKIGYASGRIVDSFTTEYKASGDKTRTPGAYKPQSLTNEGGAATSSSAAKTPSTGASTSATKPSSTSSTVESTTRETIHPSVWARTQAAPPPGEQRYQPPALAGFKREPVSPKPQSGEPGHVWVNAERTIRIPEHVIPCPLEKGADGEIDAFCLERKLIKGLLPEFVKQLDEANGILDPHPYVPGEPYEMYKRDYTAPEVSPDQQMTGFNPNNGFSQSGFQ